MKRQIILDDQPRPVIKEFLVTPSKKLSNIVIDWNAELSLGHIPISTFCRQIVSAIHGLLRISVKLLEEDLLEVGKFGLAHGKKTEKYRMPNICFHTLLSMSVVSLIML